jgi:hypothetical protein
MRKRPIERPTHRPKDNIKTDVNKTLLENVNGNELAQGTVN